jgi:hypothetical protein
MRFPDYQEMDEPLLCFIYLNGGSGYAIRPGFTYEPLAEFFGLTREDRRRPRSDGFPGVQWQNRLQWERQRLINQGFVDGSTPGIWRLSPAGVNRASRLVSRYRALRLSI